MSAAPMSVRVRSGVKRALARGLYATGLLSLLVSRRLRGRAVVLTYHRVLADRDLSRSWSHPAIVVRRATFERHLAALRRHFDVLELAVFTAQVESDQPFARPACLVTFDDGWIDTYAEAWPALRAAGVPATVFLPVDFIGAEHMFWQERASALLAAITAAARHDAAFAGRARTALAPHGLDRLLDVDAAGARQAIMDAMQSLKAADPGSTHSPLPVLTELAAGLPGATESADGFMTWPQVREMAGAGITFGGHGVTHRLLDTLPAAEAEAEVRGTRAALERELPGHATAFCYPNGNWNEAVAAAVAAHGFRLAFSTARGSVGPGSHRYALRRINMHEDVTSSVPLFLARLAGVL
jgi:peptidoglycan/xylan/chitin deacetylase (PgdA/CDA1 family)